MTPAKPKFYVIHSVVMIEMVPSRDDAFPDSQHTTTLALKKRELRTDQIAEEVERVYRR